jgi:outer membrane protein assembly factor BamB
LGKFGDINGMQASQGAIILLTEQGFDNPLIHNGQDTIIAVDPLTGKVMWTLPYNFNDTERVLYSDTLVISRNEWGKTEALDLRTGHPKWTITDPLVPGGLNAMRDRREFESYGGFGGLPVPTDRRVVLHLADGRIQIRDVGTGDVLSERSGATPTVGGWRETAIGEYLYWTDPRGVMRASLTGSEEPARLHTRAQTDGTTSVEPCGPELVCISNHEEIIAIDDLGREAWRITTPTGAATFISGSGLATVDRENKSAVYDLRGNQLLPSGYQDSAALWADADSLLIFRQDGITGYSLTSGQGKMLGQNRVEGYCSWNATKLVCPTRDGISVWTYALS